MTFTELKFSQEKWNEIKFEIEWNDVNQGITIYIYIYI